MTHDPEQPPERQSRLEAELLEILRRTDRPPTLLDRIRAALRQLVALRSASAPAGRAAGLARHLDVGLWLVACIVLALTAYFLRDASPFIARLLALLSVGCFLFPIGRSLLRPRGPSAKRWRGREIDLEQPPRPLWVDRVFRGPRRPRRH